MGLLCGLGGGSGNVLLFHLLDDTDSDGLPHVTNGETSQRREVGEGLNAHGLRGDELHNSGITGLDGFGVGLGGLTGTPVNLNKRKFDINIWSCKNWPLVLKNGSIFF